MSIKINELRKVSPLEEESSSSRRRAIKPPSVKRRRTSEVKCDICHDRGYNRWAKGCCSLCNSVVCEDHLVKIYAKYYCINCKNDTKQDSSGVLIAVHKHENMRTSWFGFIRNWKCFP
jgi:hypothetical protein